MNCSDGGLLVPKRIRIKKRGFVSWLWRIVGSERGYETKDLHEALYRMALDMAVVRKELMPMLDER